jgi:hypothetical protein
MGKRKMFSKIARTRLFRVNRPSIYDWLGRGCPVLSWSKAHLLRQRWGSDESVADMEKQARARMKSMLK